jgi:hypothetical protein
MAAIVHAARDRRIEEGSILMGKGRFVFNWERWESAGESSAASTPAVRRRGRIADDRPAIPAAAPKVPAPEQNRFVPASYTQTRRFTASMDFDMK